MNPTDKLPLNQQTDTTHHASESDTKAAAHQQVGTDASNHSFKKIDLSPHSSDLSQLLSTARRVDDFSKVTIRHDIYSSHIPVYEEPIQGRISAAKDCNPYTCAQVKEMVQEDVADFKTVYDYNSLHNVYAFLKFFESERKMDPNISEVDAFKKFKPNTTDEVFTTNGSSCTGNSTAILAILKERYQLNGHVVVETEGPNTPAFHAAAMIPCKDGIALIDVGLRAVNEILFDNQKTIGGEEYQIRQDFMILETPGNYHSKKIMIFTQDIEGDKVTEKQTEIILRPLAKPEHTVMKQHLIEADFYPITGRNSFAIKINAIKNTVTFQRGEKEDDKFRLPFSAFKEGWFDVEKLTPQEKKQCRRVIGQKFFTAFSTGVSSLKEEIIYVAQNGSALTNLFKQVGRDTAKP